jgi:hypothetical protein
MANSKTWGLAATVAAPSFILDRIIRGDIMVTCSPETGFMEPFIARFISDNVEGGIR